MSYKPFAALLIASFVFYAGCDTDPLTNAVDDFAVVVDLEEINTGISIGVYDYQTNDLVDQDVTIEFAEESAAYTVDILSNPIQSDEFDGGIYNVGIANDEIPTSEEPLDITMTVSAPGYLSRTTKITLVDTGLTSVDLQLYPENNPPDNYTTTEITAERDADGNPKPLDIPFDTTDGSSNLPSNFETSANFKTKSIQNTSQFNTFSFPFILVEKGSKVEFPDGTDIRWEFEDGSSFVGNPSQYLIQTRVWSTNPSLVEGGEVIFYGWGDIEINIPVMKFLEIINFKVKTENSGNQFKDVASIAPVNEDEIVHILYATLNPDSEIPNAVEWFDKFVRFMGCTSAEDCDKGMSAATRLDERVTAKHTSVDQFSLSERFINIREHAADQPSIYTIYGDRDNKDEFAQKLIITHTKHEYPEPPEFKPIHAEYSGSTLDFFILNIKLNLPAGIDSEDLEISVLNAGVKTGGHRLVDNNLNQGLRLSHTYTRITVSGKGIYHTEVHDFSDVQGDNHEITINVPAPPPNAVSANVTAKLVCEDRSQKVTITEPPLATYRYREAGTKNSYVSGKKITWDYDSSEQRLKSGSTTLDGVEIGKTYSVQLTIAGQNEKTELTIDSEDFEFTQEVPSDYCN